MQHTKSLNWIIIKNIFIDESKKPNKQYEEEEEKGEKMC